MKTAYWIVTGLFCLMMLAGAVIVALILLLMTSYTLGKQVYG